MEEEVFDPVDAVKAAAKNSPWVVISIMIHVVIIAIVSVVYVHHQLTKDNAPPTSVAISASTKDKLEDIVMPPEVIDRSALPQR